MSKFSQCALLILGLFPTSLFADCTKHFGEYQSSESGGSLVLDGNFFKLTTGSTRIQGTIDNFVASEDSKSLMNASLKHAFCTKNKLFIPYIAEELLMGKFPFQVVRWIELGLKRNHEGRSFSGSVFGSTHEFKFNKAVRGKFYSAGDVPFEQELPTPHLPQERPQQSLQVQVTNLVRAIESTNSPSKGSGLFPCSAQSLHPFEGFEDFGNLGDFENLRYTDPVRQNEPQTNAPTKGKRPDKDPVQLELEINRMDDLQEFDRIVEKQRLEDEEYKRQQQAKAAEKAEKARIKAERVRLGSGEIAKAKQSVLIAKKVQSTKLGQNIQKLEALQATVNADLKKFEEVRKKNKLQKREKSEPNTNLKPRTVQEAFLPAGPAQEKKLKKDPQSRFENE